jgi:hypothetical protein
MTTQSAVTQVTICKLKKNYNKNARYLREKGGI